MERIKKIVNEIIKINKKFSKISILSSIFLFVIFEFILNNLGTHKNILLFTLISFILFLIILTVNIYEIFFVSRKFNSVIKSMKKTIEDEEKVIEEYKNNLIEIENKINKKIELRFWNRIKSHIGDEVNYFLKKLKENKKEEKEIEDEFDYKIIFKKLLDITKKIENYYDYIQKEDIEKINKIKKDFCTIYNLNEIVFEFSKLLKEDIIAKFNNVLNNFQEVKNSFEDVNSELVKNLEEFKIKRENEKKSLNNNINVTDDFNKRVEIVEKEFRKSLDYYFGQFELIFNFIKEIKELLSNFKVLSLNLNIEASKSRNNAFVIISKEFHKLASKIEEFNNRVLKNIEESLEEIMEEKKKREKELEELTRIIENLISVREKYYEDSRLLKEVFDKILNYITIENEGNYDKVNKLFKNLQELSILIDIISSLNKFENDEIENNKEELQNEIGGNLELCLEEDVKKDNYKRIIENLEKIVTTKHEREVLKNLYKKYLGKEIKEEETKDIIIF